MKSSVRVFLMGVVGAAFLGWSAFAASPAFAQEFTLNSHKIQVVHGSTPNTDSTSMTLDITNNGDGSCPDIDDDLIADGLSEIALSGCSCEDIVYCWLMDCTKPFDDNIPVGGFVSHIINHHQYATFFSSTEPGGAGSTTLSAKATTLATPTGTCGRWTLNLTGTKLDLSSITTSSMANPIALFIADNDGSPEQCFDITDAIVGPVIVH